MTRDDAALLVGYAKARAADDARVSATAYAALLAASPDSPELAERAMRQAVAAGDRSLALTAARAVVRPGPAAVEARLLLYSEALRRRDWAGVDAALTGIASEPVFGLLVPILRAWAAHDRGSKGAAEMIAAGTTDPAVAAYAAEHHALLLIANGRFEPGRVALEPLLAPVTARSTRLRIAAAAALASERKRDAALGLLAGDELPLVRARDLVSRRERLPGAITDGQSGVAELLVRVAGDVAAQEAPEVALGFARLAALLAPASGETALLIGRLLTDKGDSEAAVRALTAVPPNDPYAPLADDSRIRSLAEAGRADAALAAAAAAAEADGVVGWGRYGDLLVEKERFAEAADAYARAIAAPRRADAPAEWLLHLLHGSALDRAGRWAEARPALERALALAPDEATILNYLGYAQLEKRENIPAAQVLIEQASRLRPEDPAITDSLGWSYYVRGRVEQAIPLLERAAAGDAGDPAIHEHLGDAYYAAGRRHEARFAWTAALLGSDDKAGRRLRAKIEAGLSPELGAP